MDPDMVRQQAEAEREALALLRKKPAGPAPASAAATQHAILTAAAQDASPAPHEVTAPQTSEAGLTAGAVLQARAAALPEAPPPEPQAAAPAPRANGLRWRRNSGGSFRSASPARCSAADWASPARTICNCRRILRSSRFSARPHSSPGLAPSLHSIRRRPTNSGAGHPGDAAAGREVTALDFETAQGH